MCMNVFLFAVCACVHACMRACMCACVMTSKWQHCPCTAVHSLVPSPPLPLTKWPRKRWSGIFGPISWLASTHLEYFWPIRSPLDHMLTKPRTSLVREDIEDSLMFLFGSWICHRTRSQSWTIHNPRKNAYTLRLLPIQLHIRGLCVVFGRHVTK